MKYEDFESFVDAQKQAKTFTIIITLNDSSRNQIMSSNIPISEYSSTDLMLSEALVTKSVVSVWNARDQTVYNVPAENIAYITYRFN